MTTQLTFRSCLAGIDPAALRHMIPSLTLIGSSPPVILSEIDVGAIGSLEPDVLVMNVDALEADPLEAIRMVRFVLQTCIITVLTSTLTKSWGRSCHLAGANCLLSYHANEDEIAWGLMHAMRSGCFTDPAFEAA